MNAPIATNTGSIIEDESSMEYGSGVRGPLARLFLPVDGLSSISSPLHSSTSGNGGNLGTS